MKIYEMKQERATVTASIRSLIDEFDGKTMPQDKKDELAKMENVFDALNAGIVKEEAQAERERIVGEIKEAPKGERKSEIRAMFAKALTGEPSFIKEYQNALSLGVDATAGYLTAPVEFVAELIKGLNDFLFMRQLSRVVGPIGQAQSLGYPYRATAAADATWVAEVTTAPEETTLAYGRREFKPNKMAKMIKVSKTLISHASMAENAVKEEMLLRIANGAENAYLNGSGTNEPLGIFIASANGINTDRDVTTGNTDTTVTFDGLTEAKYALKQQYWKNANWIMHRDLAKMMAKIKDGEGQYIWAGSVVTGQPDRLLSFPVNMSEYAPNTFTSAKYLAVLGDFKQGYWICDADGLNVQELRELYSLPIQIGYLVDYFGDGAPVLPEAFVRVKTT
jgi:HK97 family phage major capsid protein